MNKALKRALERQRAIADLAKSENRDLTETEQREFDSLQSVIDAINEEPTEPAAGRRSAAEDNPTPAEPEGAGNGQPEQRSAEGGATQDPAIPTASVVEITNICRHYGVDAAPYFQRGMTPQQVSADIIRRQMAENTPLAGRVVVTQDEADKLRRAMADGVVLRGGGVLSKPADGSNNYRAMSIRDIAIECMERDHGGKDFRHMTPDKLYSEAAREFFNPEATFPAIMDDVIQKSYVEGLTKARVSFDRWTKAGSLPNFKKTTNHEYIMSLNGTLEKVPENGELKAYTPTDVKMPERQLETWGRQFTMSRKAFIDDDIGLITTMPRRYAEMSMRTQNEEVYKILMNNKNIFDGGKLFSASRKNTLTTGTKPTLAAIQKMIYMIGIQKDSAGNQLALTPDLFIVPFGLGVELQTILGSPTIQTTDNTQAINPYYGKNFEVVEDVFLNSFIGENDAAPWFMGCKNEIIQIDYLNGQKEATIRRSEKPGVLGFIWDIYFDFGVSVLHPEAICRNPGVQLTV